MNNIFKVNKIVKKDFSNNSIDYSKNNNQLNLNEDNHTNFNCDNQNLSTQPNHKDDLVNINDTSSLNVEVILSNTESKTNQNTNFNMKNSSDSIVNQTTSSESLVRKILISQGVNLKKLEKLEKLDKVDNQEKPDKKIVITQKKKNEEDMRAIQELIKQKRLSESVLKNPDNSETNNLNINSSNTNSYSYNHNFNSKSNNNINGKKQSLNVLDKRVNLLSDCLNSPLTELTTINTMENNFNNKALNKTEYVKYTKPNKLNSCFTTKKAEKIGSNKNSNLNETQLPKNLQHDTQANSKVSPKSIIFPRFNKTDLEVSHL